MHCHAESASMRRTRPEIKVGEQLLTVTEAAPLLHLHRQTVQEFCSAGKIRCTKPGRKFLIPVAAITEYLTRRAVPMISREQDAKP